MSKKQDRGLELPVQSRTPLFVNCQKCRERWKVCTMPAPLEIFAKSIKNAVCPNCGESKAISFDPPASGAKLEAESKK